MKGGLASAPTLKIYVEIVMSKNIKGLIRIGFPLEIDEDEDWPPYSVEHLWVRPVGETFYVRSFPFFVKGMAFDDLISAVVDAYGYVSQWSTIKPSSRPC